MINSMTGFGSASINSPECAVSVEVRSVNNRYLSLKARLPGLLSSLESRIDEIVRRKVTRGTVDLFVRLDMKNSDVVWRINEKLLDDYARSARRLARKRGVRSGELAPEALMALPGVIESREKRTVPPKVMKIVAETVEKAVDKLARTRAAEGKRLAAAISKRRRLLGTVVGKIARRAPVARAGNVERVRKRVEDLLDGQKLEAGDPTLQREIAFLADRNDITEELDRLQSHLKQFDATLAAGGGVGRALDFLIQEMGREINTVGAKASDALISQHVVDAKAELEKIREQVQNIE
jgi:uncharacterized protein (TIGR00255 family)